MKYTSRLITLALTTAAVSEIQGTPGPNSDAGCCAQPAFVARASAATMPAEALTELERAALIEKRCDAKLAHEVCIALEKQFEIMLFASPVVAFDPASPAPLMRQFVAMKRLVRPLAYIAIG